MVAEIKRSWLRGLAVHQSRPTYRFDTECQSPVASLGFYRLLTPQADLSLRHLGFDLFRRGAIHRTLRFMIAPPQHRLYFLPELQGHGSFRPTLGVAVRPVSGNV